jgi:pimeloyl-ACP methyl ester carboxylesterase
VNHPSLQPLAATLLAAIVSGCTAGAHADAAELPPLKLKRSGQGAPAVVFEAGLGDGASAWSKVFKDVSELSTAVSYTRPGAGRFQGIKTASDGDEIVERLRASLRAAGLMPPYLLVGHSIGGTYQLLFALRHPDEVAGVVLVDARSPEFPELCRAQHGSMCNPPAVLVALGGPAAAAEFRTVPKTMEELRPLLRPNALGSVPLTILTSGFIPLTNREFQAAWRESHVHLKALSTRSQQIDCARCGHYIQNDDPALVIDAIRKILQTAAAP